MRKPQTVQVSVGAECAPKPEFPVEVAALLAEDKAATSGKHSIMDTWVALKAEAERYGYVAALVLPFDMDNLEIEYTDPKGQRTDIFSILFDGGFVTTIQEGLPMHHEISNNMEDQAAAVRRSIERYEEIQNRRLGAQVDLEPGAKEVAHYSMIELDLR